MKVETIVAVACIVGIVTCAVILGEKVSQHVANFNIPQFKECIAK